MDIFINELAKEIGNEPRPSIINGVERIGVIWDAPTAQKAVAKVHEYTDKGENIRINGGAPGWFVTALTHAVHPCNVALFDPKLSKSIIDDLIEQRGGDAKDAAFIEPLDKGVYISVQQCPIGTPNPEGGVTFQVEEGQSATILRISTNGVYNILNLPKVVVPEVPTSKPLFINGAAPIWLTTSIVSAYQHIVPSISFYQPSKEDPGYICGITHVPNYAIGQKTLESRVNEMASPSLQQIAEQIVSEEKTVGPQEPKAVEKEGQTFDK